MTKIRCRCCHRTAEVNGPHEYRSMERCRNETYIETKGAGIPRIGGKDMSKILIWDEKRRRFEPLVEAPA